jgi:hypothetical protein
MRKARSGPAQRNGENDIDAKMTIDLSESLLRV